MTTSTQKKVYAHPIIPEALGDPPPNSTKSQISERLCVWNHQFGEYNLSNQVKCIILNQQAKSLNEHVIMPKNNEDTKIVTGTVTDIITYLFDTFGDISDQTINE